MSDFSVFDRLRRAIQLMIGRGRITAVRDTDAVQLVQVKLSYAEIRDNTPRLAEFGFASNPPEGSDAVLVFAAGDRSKGVVVATGHQGSRPKNLAPGEAMLYSQDGKYVHLTASGGLVIEAKGQDVTVNDAGTLTVNAATAVIMDTPTLKVSGDIVDNYATNTRSVAGMRVVYDGHDHPDPQGGNTGTPNQTM